LDRETSTTTLSNANLNGASGAPTYTQLVRTTIANTVGKWYWEVTPLSNGAWTHIGVSNAATAVTASDGDSINGWFYTGVAGNKRTNSTSTAYGATYTNNDVLGVALDLDTDSITFYKNGVSQGVAWSGVFAGKAVCPSVYDGANDITYAINFGQAPLHASATYDSASGGYFRYAPPTGFKALCQANLPTPAILNPELHMDVKTRTGTAATYSVTGLLFAPGLVWPKSRGRALDHALYDYVRGVQKQLESNTTTAETTEATGITAFNSDGYTGGALDQINGTTATNSFVDWLWKLGGAPTTDNVAGVGAVPTAGSVKIDGANSSATLAGTIAATRLSANTVAGQSVVKVTGTAANATVAHGLLSVPELIIAKAYSQTTEWPTYCANLANTEYLVLNTTAAKATAATYWNSTTPTPTVFSLGSSTNTNNTNGMVFHCFHSVAGYSKIGKFTAGGVDGNDAYVDCGFKPKYILLKRIEATSDWFVWDTARGTYNVVGPEVYPNLTSAEGTVTRLDITANGFKVRAAAASNPNVSTAQYIYYAVADVAGKYSLGR
jgi:hypothetical protein